MNKRTCEVCRWCKSYDKNSEYQVICAPHNYRCTDAFIKVPVLVDQSKCSRFVFSPAKEEKLKKRDKA